MKKIDLNNSSIEDLKLEKLRREIRENSVTWNFLIKLFTIVAPALTVIITFIILKNLNVFEVNEKQLETEKYALEIQKHDLDQNITKQRKDSINLSRQNQSLFKENKRLSTQNLLLIAGIKESKNKEELIMSEFDAITLKLNIANIDLDRKKDTVNILRNQAGNLKTVVDELLKQQATIYKGLKMSEGYLEHDTVTYRFIIKSLAQYTSGLIKLIELENGKHNLHLNIDSIKAQRPNSAYEPSRAY